MVEIIVESVDAFGLATLVSKTAVVVQSDHSTGLLQSFLMKKVRVAMVLKTPDAGDAIILGMARGDATVTEIKTALETIQLERDLQQQANVRMVIHELTRAFPGLESANGGVRVLNYEVSIGGGKGIPFEDGDGWKWFCYNLDDGDLIAGSEVMGQNTIYGVWL